MPRHGYGLGYRSQLAQHYWPKPKAIDWVEVITENFLQVGGLPRRNLERLADAYPIALHGVGLSIGSEHEVNPRYLQAWTQLIEEFKPIHVTDHLCWTSHKAHYSHDLLPISYEPKTLFRIADRLHHLQDIIGRKILLENPSAYVLSAHAAMPEAEFFAELVHRTGCGILLDVNNLVVNYYNLSQDPLAYIETLPNKSVEQFHLSGHTINPNIRIDTHDQPMVPEAWELFAIVQARFPEADPLLEWDDNWPEFDYLLGELQKARTIVATPKLVSEAATAWHARLKNVKNNTSKYQPSDISKASPAAYHGDFWNVIVGTPSQVEPLSESGHFTATVPTAVANGLFVYHNGYGFRTEDALSSTFKTLKGVMSEESFHLLAMRYRNRYPHEHFSMSDIGRHLPQYLRDNPDHLDFGSTPVALYADIAMIDWTRHDNAVVPDQTYLTIAALQDLTPESWEELRLTFADTYHVQALSYNVLPTVVAVYNEEQPEKPEPREHFFHCYRLDTQVLHDHCEDLVALMYHEFAGRKCFSEVVATLQNNHELDDETAISRVAAQVGWWLHNSCVIGMTSEPGG